jgi:hypothetical protein
LIGFLPPRIEARIKVTGALNPELLDNRMAALGMSLHLRHAVPELLRERGFRG